MDNQTVPNPLAQDEQRARIIKIALLGTAFAMTCVLFSAAFTWFQPDQFSLSDRYFPTSTFTVTPTVTITPTLTLTPTATSTPTPNLTATERAFRSASTAMALHAIATKAASEWQEVYLETFDNNDKGWFVDTQDDEYSKITFEVKDGKYRWNALAHQGFIYWVPLGTKSVEDFYLSVEVMLGDHTTSNDYGIVFRQDFSGNFYYFGIDSDQRYSLYKFYKAEWTALIDRTLTSAIERDQPNRLAVIAEGDHIMLFINDQFIADEYDDQLKRGTAALAIEIFEPDQQAIFEFDNIQLRVP
jgi:hypothetical protein